jgi:C4-dicarboxylate-specific signal transduction histidine kinase
MKSKILLSILLVMLILLATSTYSLRNQLDKQYERFELQSKTIDSLLFIIEDRMAKEQHMREKAQQIIAETQKKADSLRKANQSN